MSAKQLNDIQIELLEALKWLDRFCQAHGIYYSLHGGTLLGAVREKGFIAWDDDADVTFTREEYQKFENALLREGEVYPNLLFESKRRYPKLYYKRAGKPAVWIDIFIYDAISENVLIQKIKKIRLYYYMLILRNPSTLQIIQHTKQEKRLTWLMMRALNAWGKHIPFEKKVIGAQRAAQSLGGSGKLIHRANDQKSGINEIQPAYVMTKYVRTEFEDTKLMISVYYDEILTKSYGSNYMTPKRKGNQLTSDESVRVERETAEHLFEKKAGTL